MNDGRQKILCAAVEIIEQKGELALRLQDVSALSGVAATSISHHFGDRDGLVMAAQAERFRLTLAETVGPFAVAIRNAASREELRTTVIDVLRAHLADPERRVRRMTRMNAYGSAQHRGVQVHLVNEATRQMTKEFAAPFAPAQEQGWVDKNLNLEMALAWYFGAITGRSLVEHWASPEQLAHWDQVMEDAVLG